MCVCVYVCVCVCPHLDHPWLPRCWYLTECVHKSWALVDPIRPRGRARTLGGPPSDPGSVGMGSHPHQTRGGGCQRAASNSGGGRGLGGPIRPKGIGGSGAGGCHQTQERAPIRPR